MVKIMTYFTDKFLIDPLSLENSRKALHQVNDSGTSECKRSRIGVVSVEENFRTSTNLKSIIRAFQ